MLPIQEDFVSEVPQATGLAAVLVHHGLRPEDRLRPRGECTATITCFMLPVLICCGASVACTMHEMPTHRHSICALMSGSVLFSAVARHRCHKICLSRNYDTSHDAD